MWMAGRFVIDLQMKIRPVFVMDLGETEKEGPFVAHEQGFKLLPKLKIKEDKQ